MPRRVRRVQVCTHLTKHRQATSWIHASCTTGTSRCIVLDILAAAPESCQHGLSKSTGATIDATAGCWVCLHAPQVVSGGLLTPSTVAMSHPLTLASTLASEAAAQTANRCVREALRRTDTFRLSSCVDQCQESQGRQRRFWLLFYAGKITKVEF